MTTSQETNLKTFKLIRLLYRKPYRTYEELAYLLGTTIRTIRRYFDTLREIGYEIKQDYYRRHYIDIDIYPAEKGVSFTKEETELLWHLLQTDAHQHTLQGDILKKLFIPPEFHPMADQYLRSNNAKNVAKLSQVIREKKQVIILDYYSANSDSITDRLVESLSFSENYQSLYLFDIESKDERTYKIDRIKGGVEILDTPQTYNKPSKPIDWFGFTGEAPIAIDIRLTRFAATLLSEEFLGTKPFIIDTNSRNAEFPMSFKAEVRDFEGIGRFILGIPGQTQIKSPLSLKNHLNSRIKKLKF
ncbi:MAG TPA: hypothetical protein DCS93_04240 [Microscillaceae bacterium]|nr:hypothetical protein [Microscillaceae bacterium]